MKMNGVCGSGTATIDPRGSLTSSISPNKRAMLIAGIGSGSVNVSGCNVTTAQGPVDSSVMRKSRSQGGKRLQKCLSTASYGEDLSISYRFQSPATQASCHNANALLLSRQYCSFGSTTSYFTITTLTYPL